MSLGVTVCIALASWRQGEGVSTGANALARVYPFRYARTMTTVRNLRSLAEVTQTDLARAARTSQPTVAAYEAGTKSPTLATVERLAAAVGMEAVVVYVSPLTREDRRSLALHHVIAQRLRRDPDTVLGVARRNLAKTRDAHPHAHELLNEWRDILERPVSSIVETLVDPSMHARALRQLTPFAGVLSPRERSVAYSRFAASERRR